MSESLKLSLWNLESQLVELFDLRAEAYATASADNSEENRNACDVIEAEITRYIHAEVVKVDGIREYARHCALMADAAKAESKAQSDRSKAWSDRLKRLKDGVQVCMEAMGRKKLEGKTGTLSLRGNGGVQPVDVYDESLVPDELCDFEGRIPGMAWLRIIDLLERHYVPTVDRESMLAHVTGAMKRAPRKSLIGDALNKKCENPLCGGSGEILPSGPSDAPVEVCPDCNGSGKASVPGCRLLDRGVSVQIS